MSELIEQIKFGVNLVAEELAESSSSDDEEEIEFVMKIIKERKRKHSVQDFVFTS